MINMTLSDYIVYTMAIFDYDIIKPRLGAFFSHLDKLKASFFK